MHSDTLFIGIDAGGSSTTLRARRADVAEHDALQLSGPASNLRRAGILRVARQLADLTQQALEQLPARQVSLYAGVAGAGSSRDRNALAAQIRDLLPAAKNRHIVHVVHDASIALHAAFGSESGMILIAGTGSIVYARREDGRLERAGGWGYLIGDEGSGHALGIAALRAVSHAIDGGPPTLLRELVAEEHDLVTRDAIIRQVYDEQFRLQELAPLVLQAADRGDSPARDLLASAVQSLARQAQWLAERCSDALKSQLALHGGLIGERPYREALTAALEEVLPGWSITPVARLPVEAALELAESAAASENPSH